MKLVYISILSLGMLFLSGCQSTGSETAAQTDSSEMGDDGTQTADTGSRLLMDRYKSGEIPGLQD